MRRGDRVGSSPSAVVTSHVSQVKTVIHVGSGRAGRPKHGSGITGAFMFGDSNPGQHSKTSHPSPINGKKSPRMLKHRRSGSIQEKPEKTGKEISTAFRFFASARVLTRPRLRASILAF